MFGAGEPGPVMTAAEGALLLAVMEGADPERVAELRQAVLEERIRPELRERWVGARAAVLRSREAMRRLTVETGLTEVPESWYAEAGLLALEDPNG